MARGKVVRGHVRRDQRKTTWVGPALQNFIAVAAGAKVIVASFDASAAGFPSPTVVRTRGQVQTGPGTGIVVDKEIIGAYGLAVVTDRAFAAGVASVPGPFTDAGWNGWFVWRSFHYVQEAAGTVATLLQQTASQEVDSKAMRRVTDDETVVLVAESQLGAFSISMPLRLLFMLS